MNNTRTLTEIAPILMAATLVVGGTLRRASAQSVFPLPNIGAQNDGKGGNGARSSGGSGGVHPVACVAFIRAAVMAAVAEVMAAVAIMVKEEAVAIMVKEGGDGNGSTLQSCQQTFTSVLSQKQIDDFEAAALSVFPSPPQKLTVVDLCKILTTGTMTEQLMNRILSGAQSIDVQTGLSLKSRLVGNGIKFAPVSTLQSCQQTFTSVLSQKQIDDFEAVSPKRVPITTSKIDSCRPMQNTYNRHNDRATNE